MVDWVWEVNPKTIVIDVCQSSTNGAQCNSRVVLEETDHFAPEQRRKFKILNVGSPRMPVQGYVFIMRRKNFFW